LIKIAILVLESNGKLKAMNCTHSPLNHQLTESQKSLSQSLAFISSQDRVIQIPWWKYIYIAKRQNPTSLLDDTDLKSLLAVVSKNVGNLLKQEEKFITYSSFAVASNLQLCRPHATKQCFVTHSNWLLQTSPLTVGASLVSQFL